MTVGRPRKFDPDAVLETAMELFWEHGFEGVSISDLTAATGINRRSLYAHFGSKDDLFGQAVARYMAGPAAYIAEALMRPSAWLVAHAIVHGAVDANTTEGRPRGCLLVQSALAAGEESEAVRLDLLRRRQDGVEALARRFDDFQSGGELAGADSLALSRWINAVCQGIAIQARSGASRGELHELAELALTGWPASRSR
jgi:AcrR family transcriptional regulator